MDASAGPDVSSLPEIPLVDVESGDAAALIDAQPDLFDAIMAAGLEHYGAGALRRGDGLSRRWLARNANPYRVEVAEISRRADQPGAYLLNLSYEWTCTTGVGADPGGEGSRMLRTLDWPLDGLGRNVVVARTSAEAGPYFNITWPGFAGIATAMAPGRFAAALNQPPMRRWTRSCWLDWGINRVRVWGRRALPPVHLLRKVFDTCGSYAEAKAALTGMPLAMPAFFTLSGTAPDEGCIIEREEDRAHVRDAPASVANHWLAAHVPGRARGIDSDGRFALMEELRDTAGDDFAWVRPPILNETTRLAVAANAARGSLSVQGWERDGPVTAVFRLPA